MVVKLTETFATSILLILLAVFVLHLIRGDAMGWVTSKFSVFEPQLGTGNSSSDHRTLPK